MRMHIETTTMNKTPTTESDSVRQRLREVALYGLAAQDDALLAEPWVERVIDIEDRERKRRSLERRLANARIVDHGRNDLFEHCAHDAFARLKPRASLRYCS